MLPVCVCVCDTFPVINVLIWTKLMSSVTQSDILSASKHTSGAHLLYISGPFVSLGFCHLRWALPVLPCQRPRCRVSQPSP